MPFTAALLIQMLAGVALAVVLAWLGVFVVMKRMSFIADGIAHVSLAGVAIGFLFHLQPLFSALVFSLAVGVLIYYLERKTTLPVDTIITLLFTASLAVGILLMHRAGGGELEALEEVLFGDLGQVAVWQLQLIVALAAAIAGVLAQITRPLALLVFDRATAYVAGVPIARLELLLYLILVITIVLGINLFGVLLVSALMVIPASAAKLVSRSFHGAIALAMVFGGLIVLAGLPIALAFDLPSGSVVVISGVILFTFMMGVHRFAYVRRRSPPLPPP